MYKLICLVAVSCFSLLITAETEAETRLTYDIQTALADHPEVDHQAIVVDDHRWGQVSLRGHVPNERQSKVVDEIVMSMPGVRDVQNELTTERAMLRPTEPVTEIRVDDQRDDQTIESELNRFLPEAITTSVRDGRVTLEGDVAIHGEADEFLARALNVPGVTEIDNRITINGEPYMEVWRQTNAESQRASKRLK
jgi:osmotically-inducible protein OsmY